VYFLVTVEHSEVCGGLIVKCNSEVYFLVTVEHSEVCGGLIVKCNNEVCIACCELMTNEEISHSRKRYASWNFLELVYRCRIHLSKPFPKSTLNIENLSGGQYPENVIHRRLVDITSLAVSISSLTKTVH
jgi:hypothetical protein